MNNYLTLEIIACVMVASKSISGDAHVRGDVPHAAANPESKSWRRCNVSNGREALHQYTNT